MGPVIDKKKESDPNSPKILCQMDHHMGNLLRVTLILDLLFKNHLN